MKLNLVMSALLSHLVLGWTTAHAAPALTNSVSTNRVLRIDPSSMPVAGGKATLTIGALQRVAGVYTGGYQIDVFPYVYKSEKGRLAMVVSDESIATVSRGMVAAIIGTATTIGKGGRTRKIDATATPSGTDHGTLKLWFMAGARKMIFETTYRFAEKESAPIPANPKEP